MPSNPIHWNVEKIGQPTNTTCWAAAIAMLKNQKVNDVINSTPAELVAPDGSLYNYANEEDWLTGTRKFANSHNLGFSAPQSWSPSGVYNKLKEKPLVFDMLWRAEEYSSGKGSPGHMVCIIGMSGDKGSDIIIYNDPWPPNEGKIVNITYKDWVTKLPALTYRVFWKM